MIPSIQTLITTAVLIAILDIPWLFLTGSSFLQMVQRIQGGASASTRAWAAIPVYLALSFLLLQSRSLSQAALIGLSTYAVFDFTNMAVFKDYCIYTAIADTFWGAILFSLAFSVRQRIGFL